MSQPIVITDVTIPADSFALGRILQEYPEVQVELERMVPVHDAIIPLFWVGGADPEAVLETLRNDPLTVRVKILTETTGRTLFEVRWASDNDRVVQPVMESNARLLSGEGTADEWSLRLQFNDREDLSTFRRMCQEEDIQIELKRIFDPSWPVEENPLTAEQTDAIMTAWENGYFEVPRDVTLEGVADLIGISDNSASQRIRRGLSTLVETTIASRY